ncbi:MAG: hypothetical protein JF606_26915 [Burkholderiales bacterium]|nr:hypothetical protein [Burkholderiales bacterium]
MNNTSRNLVPKLGASTSRQPCDIPNVETRSALEKRGIEGAALGKNPCLLLLSAADNCLVVWAPIRSGTRLRLGDEDLTVSHTMTRGLTITRHGLRQGDQVVRCGIIIGTAACDIAAGERLHSRNLKKGDGTPTSRWPRRVARHPVQTGHSSRGCAELH